MRLALALAALVIAAGPAAAEDPPETAKAGLRAILTAVVAGRNCPGMHINDAGLRSMFTELGLVPEDITERYKYFSDQYTVKILNYLRSDPEKVCGASFGIFGPEGKLAGALEKD